mgnify:CR=1 FL=1
MGNYFCKFIIWRYIIANISATFSLITRKKLFDKVENLAMHEVKQFSTSSLITRTTNDITQVEMLLDYMDRELLDMFYYYCDININSSNRTSMEYVKRLIRNRINN